MPHYLYDNYEASANDWAVLMYKKEKELPVLKDFKEPLWFIDTEGEIFNERQLVYVTYDFHSKLPNQMVENWGDFTVKPNGKNPLWHQAGFKKNLDDRVWILEPKQPEIKVGMSGAALFATPYPRVNKNKVLRGIVGVISKSNRFVFDDKYEESQEVACRFNKARASFLNRITNGIIAAKHKWDLIRANEKNAHANAHIAYSNIDEFHFDEDAEYGEYDENEMENMFTDLLLLDAILIFGCLGCLCLSIGIAFGYFIHFIERRKIRF